MIEPSSNSTSVSFRPRTVSTPSRAQEEIAVTTSWIPANEDHKVQSPVDSLLRAQRSPATTSSSSSYFSFTKSRLSSPLSFFSKRKPTQKASQSPTTQQQTQQQPNQPLTVIEISAERSSPHENNEEAERERLRDAAAQALGLGLGRDDVKSTETDPAADGDEDDTDITAVSEVTHPYLRDQSSRQAASDVSPNSLTFLPHQLYSPSSVTHSDSIPPYPSALSALTPYIQTRSTLLRYHPSGSFLALSFARRTKQWRSRHVILTVPSPNSFTLAHSDILMPSGQRRSNAYIAPQHAHLHLFKNATPTADELEIDRLEINEDSVVFAAEQEIAGLRGIVKVGGRDARNGIPSSGASVKSVARSWHAGTPTLEQSIEEMGRTMWILKVADGNEAQRWIGSIKTAVLVQRAERAGMLQQNGSISGASIMQTDYDILLSSRPQSFLSGMGKYTGSDSLNLSLPRNTNGAAAMSSSPPSNPRYAEHVGATPSHTSPPASFRARTHPTPSNMGLPSFKTIFGSEHNHTPPPTPIPESHENIDPITDDAGNSGSRATALFNIFRSGSRVSYGSHGRTSVSPFLPVQSPEPEIPDIDTPIVPKPIIDEVARQPVPSADASFSIDWETMRGGSKNGNNNSRSTYSSLPPPPRNQRRPWTSSVVRETQREGALSSGKAIHAEASDAGGASPPLPSNALTPPLSPYMSSPSLVASTVRPASMNSTSSLTSVERDRLSDVSRRPSRTVPKMLAPPTGPPPEVPPIPPTSNGPPPSTSEQDYSRQNGGGRLERSPSYSSPNHPYSKRVSSSSTRSVNSVSTGHSFLGAKAHPPPRPPPKFAPPPAPLAEQPEVPSVNRLSSQSLPHPRSLRVSLPPTAPPSHSLPPRPDELGTRHRKAISTEVRSTSNRMYTIPGSPTFHSKVSQPPKAPPPSGPLPPTPRLEIDSVVPTVRGVRHLSLMQRLRTVAPHGPPHLAPITLHKKEPSGAAAAGRVQHLGEPIVPRPEEMFLNMNDASTTPATPQSFSFLHVTSPLQSSSDDAEPTPLSPPPRRNSRTSKEIQRLPNFDRDEPKYPLNSSLDSHEATMIIIAQS